MVERRKRYTIFFSSNDGKDTDRTEAGVAIMIKNTHLNKIVDVDPISDRIMAITLRGTVTHTHSSTHTCTPANTQGKTQNNTDN